MTVTPHDYHQMTDLRCDSLLTNLEGESGTQLLGQRHTTEKVHYFNLEMDHRPLP